MTSHTFDRDILPILGRMSIKTITRADVNHVIDEVLARGSDVHANRVLARLRAFFNWAVERGEVTASPLVGMKLPTWPEVDFKNRTWIEPREKTKNNRTHEVQLSGPAIELLRSIPRISEDFIFTSSGEKPVSGFSHAKRRLDQAMLAVKRDELGADCDPIPPWTLHDLRRTAATGMARLNFLPHFVDKILNHTSGTIRGVAAVYNRFEYLEERRAALEAWGQFIENLVSPTPSNVVPLVAGQER